MNRPPAGAGSTESDRREEVSMMEELVSVVIPTYSRPSLLPRALSSVIGQTHRNLEILVVDDNANDPDSRSAVEGIVEELQDGRIRLIRNGRNLGGALSRNAGIEQASGEYVAFLDDDDEYLPEKTARQLERFRTSELPKLALVYCHTVMMEAAGKPLEEYRYTFRGNCVFEGMRDCIAATSQWMCRKDALRAVGCFSDVPCKQDSNLIVKLLVSGYSVDFVPDVLSRYYRDAGGGISTQGPLRRIAGEEALRTLCRQHYGLLTEKQREEVEYAFALRLAGHYRAAGRRDEYRAERNRLLRHPLRRKTLGTLKQILLNG